MTKLPKYPIHDSLYFDVREFVHPKVWNTFKMNAQWQVDPRIVRVADAVRLRFGTTYINNWMFGGQRNASGYRARWETEGAEYSQHRAGRAIDVRFKDYTVEQAFKIIMNEWQLFYDAGLTCIENIEFTKTWLHLDCRPVKIEPGKFLIVNPQ